MIKVLCSPGSRGLWLAQGALTSPASWAVAVGRGGCVALWGRSTVSGRAVGREPTSIGQPYGAHLARGSCSAPSPGSAARPGSATQTRTSGGFWAPAWRCLWAASRACGHGGCSARGTVPLPPSLRPRHGAPLPHPTLIQCPPPFPLRPRPSVPTPPLGPGPVALAHPVPPQAQTRCPPPSGPGGPFPPLPPEASALPLHSPIPAGPSVLTNPPSVSCCRKRAITGTPPTNSRYPRKPPPSPSFPAPIKQRLPVPPRPSSPVLELLIVVLVGVVDLLVRHAARGPPLSRQPPPRPSPQLPAAVGSPPPPNGAFKRRRPARSLARAAKAGRAIREGIG